MHFQVWQENASEFGDILLPRLAIVAGYFEYFAASNKLNHYYTICMTDVFD